MDQMHPLLGDSHVYIDGRFVSNKIANLVAAIREYSDELNVHWVPPEERKEGQAAYRIVHYPPGAEPYVVMSVRRDEDMDERILQRLIAGDQRYGKVTMNEFDAAVEAQRLTKRQEWLDKLEELNDIAAHVLKSPLNTYKVDDNITIKDYGNRSM